jgi:hypothetical protein
MIKQLLFTLALVFSVKAVAWADYVSGRGCGWIAEPNCYSLAGCAPEVKTQNVNAVDEALKNLMAGELRTSTSFKETVMKVRTLSETERASAYLGLMGLFSDEQIAEFIGSRGPRTSEIEALAKNTGLSRDEAKLVLSKVSEALLGGRR